MKTSSEPQTGSAGCLKWPWTLVSATLSDVSSKAGRDVMVSCEHVPDLWFLWAVYSYISVNICLFDVLV